MKRFTSIAIILMVAMLAMPVASHAFSNLLEIDLVGGSGDVTGGGLEADVDMGVFGATYTRYFTALETTESPYGLREFLQHPSYLSVGLESQTMEITLTGGVMSMEDTQGTFSLSGMYYLPNGTGLGATLISASGEEVSKVGGVQTDKDEIIEASIVLSVNHYVTDNMSFGVDLTSLANETEDNSGNTEEYTQQTLDFMGSALINNKIWISGLVGFGELEVDGGPTYDVSRLEIEAGFFPMQKLGVFLTVGFDKLEGDNLEITETFTSLAADYSISESISITTAVINHTEEEDDGSDTIEVDMTLLRLSLGILF